MQPLALFDLDNTLLDRDAAFAAWLDEFVTDHRLDDAARAWLAAADRRHSGPMDGWFRLVREEFGLAETVEVLWGRYRRRMPRLAVCRAEDKAALGELRAAGWRTAIVTNGMTDNQEAKIRRTGLAKLVDTWCISAEVGIRKPERGIFELAARRCGARLADGGWMTGDNLLQDIAGARAAGLRTVWLHHGRPRPEAGPAAPHHVVGTVAEAAGVLLGAGG
ncbi:HAD family hydrolase [Kitasatospora sp. NPDC002227]|uniref:HAD family hydrolase n=1 Tax=Kitasatospora sp. NPDC002227 TaxID=3154773 RepID=UPI00331B5FEB